MLSRVDLLSRGVHFVRRWCRLCPVTFVTGGGGQMMWARLVRDLMTLSLEDED